MNGLTYDTGALIAADRGNRQMMAYHTRALESGVVPVVPAAVLAQAWRGGPQPPLSRLLAGCRVEALDELVARSAGAVLALTDTSDVVDASVAVGALSRDDVVVTGDPDDIQHLATALNMPIQTEII